MSTNNKRPVLRMLETWRVLPGIAYGLRQPALLGRMLLPAHDWENVDAEQCLPALQQMSGSALRDSDGCTRFVDAVLRWVIAVQRESRMPVSERFWSAELPTDSRTDERVFEVALPYWNPRAVEISLNWVARAFGPGVFTSADGPIANSDRALEHLMQSLKRLADQRTNPCFIARAAFNLDIPLRRLVGSTYQLGIGCHSRWMDSLISDATPHISVSVARRKMQTATLLRQAGLPVRFIKGLNRLRKRRRPPRRSGIRWWSSQRMAKGDGVCLPIFETPRAWPKPFGSVFPYLKMFWSSATSKALRIA